MDLQEIYKKESGYDVGRYKIDNTNYYSGDYVEWLEKQLTIHSVSQCACTTDETTGTTSVKCCNICGKPAESFWRCG